MFGSILCLVACLGADSPPATFTVTVPRELDAVHVEASYVVSEPVIEMSEGFFADRKDGGIAEFVQNLSVTRADGSAVTTSGPEAGRWRIDAQNGDAIVVRYDVRLNHGDFRWPFGIDGVAYTRDSAAFFVSRTFLVLNENVRTARVRFVIPPEWSVATPWKPVEGDASAFDVTNRRLLMEACVLIGDFTDREVHVGDTIVRLAIGHALDPYTDTLENAARVSVRAYTDLFEDTPQVRFLAVLNDNPAGGITDGSAYPNSVSMITPKRMEGANLVQAVYTLSHEILHLWNGYRLRPATQMEWFREGFTDYLTWRTLVTNKLVPESALLVELRRQLGAYFNLNRTVSIAAAGKDSAQNTVLIYEGGSLAALCLDTLIRDRSANEHDFAEFMRRVYARSALQNAPYDESTLVGVATGLAGEDMQPFFDRYVNGVEPLPLKDSLDAFGLRMDQKKSGDRLSFTVTPDDNAKGARADARDDFLGRD